MPRALPAVELLQICIVVAVAAMLYLKWRQPTSQLNLPPGPPGHWLWGNEIPDKLWVDRLSRAVRSRLTMCTSLKCFLAIRSVDQGVWPHVFAQARSSHDHCFWDIPGKNRACVTG